jgi:hypothetical protein
LAQIALQVGGGDVVDVERQDLERQRGVALLAVDRPPARQRRVVDPRVVLGQVQAAVGRQAFQQDVAEVRGRVAARGQVQHQASLPCGCG